jgi:high-affinity iron transporter
MIPSFIISFREVLEAALVVGIILSYLVKTKQTKHNNVVYYGVISGILASIIGAFLFTKIAGGFSGRAEEIFEGVTMLAGAFLLTTMILWMMRQKHIAKEIEQRVDTEIKNTHKFGLFALVFIAVLREGIETVIFLRVLKQYNDWCTRRDNSCSPLGICNIFRINEDKLK